MTSLPEATRGAAAGAVAHGVLAREGVRAFLAFGLYLGVSAVVLGRGAIADPAGTIVGDQGADKTIFLWGLSWLPHALGQPVDPFSTSLLWAPAGTDLAWVTWTPAAALLALPVTALAGPVPAYNLLAVAAPALAGAAAFLLARGFSMPVPPALLAGFLFGFSSFVTVHATGHLNMTLVFLLPLLGLLIVRRVDGRLSSRTFVGLLAGLLGLQALFSTELFTIAVLLTAVVGAVAWLRLPALRAPIRRTAVEAVVSLALAAVLLAPLIVHALVIAGPESQPRRSAFSTSADVANVIVPTRRTLLRPPGSEAVVERFTASGAERTAYLGLPLVLAVVGFALSPQGRTRAGSVLTLSLAGVALLAFGPRIRVAGETLVPGPWAPIAHLPLLEGIKPARLTVFVALLAALAASLWLADRPRSPVRVAVAALAVLALLPNPASSLWSSEVPRPSFFASDRYRAHIHPGETVLVLPYGPTGWSMLWQAEAGFRFRLVGGHIGRNTTVAEEPWADVHQALRGGAPVPTPSSGRMRDFLEAHAVDAVVVAPGARARARRLIESLRMRSVAAGDAHVYRITPGRT